MIRPGITLDAFVAMPDHVHGILYIEDGQTAGSGRDGGVETPRGASAPSAVNRSDHSATLGTVINHFKGACTRRIRERHPSFAWQSRFWDVVIRNAHHLEAARRYVLENPARG